MIRQKLHAQVAVSDSLTEVVESVDLYRNNLGFLLHPVEIAADI